VAGNRSPFQLCLDKKYDSFIKHPPNSAVMLGFAEKLRDPLYKNSFFIMLSSITNAGFGFFFWMIAARLYSAEDVGIATALWSSLVLIILLSRLGFDFSIIRFFPNGDKSRILSTSVVISTLFAIALGLLFVAKINIFSPKLHLLKNPLYASIFLTTVLTYSVISLTAQSFIALRRGEFYFFQTVVQVSRIVVVFFLTFLGAMGIFGSFSLSLSLALIIALLLINRMIGYSLSIDKSYIKESFRFSAGNYFANLFSFAPNQILPIMVLNLLGAEKAAYYYIAFAIARLIFMIPNAISMSLFVEGSHGESLRKIVFRSIVAIACLLTPVIVFVYFLGSHILQFFGKSYIQAFELLRLFALSSFFVAIVYVYLAVKRVQIGVKNIIFLNSLTCLLLLLLSYLLIPKTGIVGVGYSWIISYSIGTLVVAYFLLRNIHKENEAY